jgi:hypothetical protein
MVVCGLVHHGWEVQVRLEDDQPVGCARSAIAWIEELTMAKIPLVEGGFATVSDAGAKYFQQFKWHQCGFCTHIFRTVKTKKGYATIYMASEVMGNPGLRVAGACNPCPAVPDIEEKGKKT